MTTTATQQTDTIPAREAAFAEWLRTALLAAMPHSIARRTEDVVYSVFDRSNVPRGLCVGDVQRALIRIANEGLIEWCDEDMASVRRRADAAAAPAGLDAYRLNRLRTLAAEGVARLASFTDNARAELVRSVDPRENVRADYIAAKTTALVSAEAREEGYRAAVADLLGALEVGQ